MLFYEKQRRLETRRKMAVGRDYRALEAGKWAKPARYRLAAPAADHEAPCSQGLIWQVKTLRPNLGQVWYLLDQQRNAQCRALGVLLFVG